MAAQKALRHEQSNAACGETHNFGKIGKTRGFHQSVKSSPAVPIRARKRGGGKQDGGAKFEG